MVRFYGFSSNELDATQGAPIFLSLEPHQPLLRVGFPSSLSLLPLCPIFLERGIVGRIPACALDEAGDRGCVGRDQFRLLFVERPIAIAPKVASFPPLTAFVRGSAFRPYPQHVPVGVSNFSEDVLGCTVSVVVCPSPSNRVECLASLCCPGLLMCVQVGAGGPDMLQDFLPLWDGQQFSPLPEFPDVEPQAVKPFCDGHNPGLRFTEYQPSFFEECLNSRSGVGCQYCPCWGRGHQVISIANDRYPCIDSLAKGWGLRSSIGVFRVEPPFHPIQCHICQQWRDYSSYKVANFFFRDQDLQRTDRPETRY